MIACSLEAGMACIRFLLNRSLVRLQPIDSGGDCKWNQNCGDDDPWPCVAGEISNRWTLHTRSQWNQHADHEACDGEYRPQPTQANDGQRKQPDFWRYLTGPGQCLVKSAFWRAIRIRCRQCNHKHQSYQPGHDQVDATPGHARSE